MKNSTLITLRSEEGETVKDQTKVAEMLANYFTTAAASIGGNHISNLTEGDLNDHKSVKSVRENFNGTCFTFKKFSMEEVQYAIESINPKKSCGWDRSLSPKLLKKVVGGIAPSLTTMYTFPTVWKMGEWTPVFRKEDREMEKNYRPITSLIRIDKIFEQLLSKQITGHYDPNLYNRMTAYRKQHSCEATLLMLVEDWKLAVDRKELVTVLSTDMSKAFDSLCHLLTIKKLEAYGFGSNSLNLILSFFSGKFNRVKLNQNTSEWKCMRRGCPQETAFGPLLWNMFQNDMSFHVKESDLIMYADDHQMYTTGKSYGVIEARLMMQGQLALSMVNWLSEIIDIKNHIAGEAIGNAEKNIREVMKFTNHQKMELNLKKCKEMLIDLRKNKTAIPLTNIENN